MRRSVSRVTQRITFMSRRRRRRRRRQRRRREFRAKLVGVGLPDKWHRPARSTLSAVGAGSDGRCRKIRVAYACRLCSHSGRPTAASGRQNVTQPHDDILCKRSATRRPYTKQRVDNAEATRLKVFERRIYGLCVDGTHTGEWRVNVTTAN
jgi:hypothetical protein